MIESLRTVAIAVFDYPLPAERRHGPLGYVDYTSFKPWLRDEFDFRCLYCLTRERWYPIGHEGFSVEHFVAQSIAPALRRKYENLFYVCCACNAARREIALPLDPTQEPLSAHVCITRAGVAEALTMEGAQFIDICRLNRPARVDFRRRLFNLLANAKEDVLMDWLAYPDDLPDLSTQRPPAGNASPAGIAESYFERRRRDELPPVY
jgi:hypothetical protein